MSKTGYKQPIGYEAGTEIPTYYLTQSSPNTSNYTASITGVTNRNLLPDLYFVVFDNTEWGDYPSGVYLVVTINGLFAEGITKDLNGQPEWGFQIEPNTKWLIIKGNGRSAFVNAPLEYYAVEPDHENSLPIGGIVFDQDREYLIYQDDVIDLTKAITGHDMTNKVIKTGITIVGNEVDSISDSFVEISLSGDALKNVNTNRIKIEARNGQIEYYTNKTSAIGSFVPIEDVTAPTLSNFNVNNTNKDRVNFNSSEIITASNFIGFTVSGKTITGIFINAGQTTGHYFTVSVAFVFGEVSSVSYIGGSNFQDVATIPNVLNNFGPTSITNNVLDTSDTTAPTFSNLRIEATINNRLYFDVSEATTGTLITGFSIPSHTIASIVNTGTTTGNYILISDTFAVGESVTLSYSGGSNIQDTAGSPNSLATFGATAVTNLLLVHPSSTTPLYFDETTRVFNGTSVFVDMGDSGPFISVANFAMILRTSILDGRPTAQQTLVGLNATNGALNFALKTDGSIRVAYRVSSVLVYAMDTAVIFADGSITNALFELDKIGNNWTLSVDGTPYTLTPSVTSSVSGDTTQNLYNGANHTLPSDIASAFFAGTQKALYWKADTLSGTDRTNVKAYINAL